MSIYDLLQKIKDQIPKQQEARKYSEKKVRELIEVRVEEYESRASIKHPKK